MTDRKRIVVVGGSAAGPKAAAKTRRIDDSAEVIILQKDPDLSMASCGYPYYVGGYFDDRNMLLCTPAGVVRNPQFYLNAKDIDARVNTEVLSIDREARQVIYRDLVTGQTNVMPYDKLISPWGPPPECPRFRGSIWRGSRPSSP
jgi:NADPH-dependent 2,4-dienoyl-CoA reductase/sulfur reductase-like enzyme